jgi:hypothetical protein
VSLIRTFLKRGQAEVRTRRFALSVAISAVCLYLVFRGVAMRDLVTALATASYIWLLPTAILLVLGLFLRALRWRALFHPRTGLRLGVLFDVLNIGYLMNNLLPVRAGDVLRAGLISAREPVSASRALATVVVERVLDVLTVVVLLALLLPVLPIPQEIARGGQIAGVSFGILGLGLMVLSTQRDRGARWTRTLLDRVPYLDAERWAGRVGDLIDGLAALRSPLALGRAVSWSLVAWLTSAVAFYLVMLAFDLALPPTAAVFVLCVTALGMIIPSTPGYLGVFDYMVVLALSLFEVERSLAVSYALVLHAVTYLAFSLAGVVSLVRYTAHVARQPVTPSSLTDGRQV